MQKALLSIACLGLILVTATAAQKPEPLPEPPKPPAYLKKKLESLKKAASKPSNSKKSSAELPSPKEARAKNGEENSPKHRRSIRVRINIPWIGLHLEINRKGSGDSPAVNVDVTVGGKLSRRRMGHENWRYRRHAGRWWYWLPKNQWVVWENGRWVEYLDKLKKTGEIRLGEPRRGEVRLKFGDLPGLNLGF